jgi:EAL domain-containing protein (putative c-di-GMP-specific phosphodiesterase class I)
MNQRHTQKQYAEGVMQSPLNIAIAKRDSQTIQMVDTAVQYKQTLLAYQPVMMSCGLRQVRFYEGLISVMDAADLIIPAKDFIHVIEDTELGRRIDALSLNMGMQSLFKNPIYGCLLIYPHAALNLGHGNAIFTVGLSVTKPQQSG